MKQAADPSRTQSTYGLTLLTLVYVLGYADRNIINLLLEPIREEYQLSDTMLGLITGLGFTAFQTLLAIPLGRYADRASRVGILTAGLLLWSLMTSMSAFVTGALMLAIARMGVGIGEACLTGPTHSLLSDFYSKEKRPRAFSIMASGGEIGIVLALLVGGWVGHEWGWRAAFLVVGAPGVLLAIIMRFTLREPSREVDRRRDGSAPAPVNQDVIGELWRTRSLVAAVIASMFMGLNIFGVGTWTPAYLHRIYQLDLAQIGATLAFLRVGLSVTGALVGGYLASAAVRRFGTTWFMLMPALICIVSGLGLAGFILSPSLPMAIVCLGLVNFTVGAQLGPVFSLVQTVAPQRSRGLAAALFVSITNLFGLGIGGLVIGATSDALAGTFGDGALKYAMFIPVTGAVVGGLIYALGSRWVASDIAKAENVGAPAGQA